MIRLYHWNGFSREISEEIENRYAGKITVQKATNQRQADDILIDTTLVEFASWYPRNFMVLRNTADDIPTVAVTRYNNFAQR